MRWHELVKLGHDKVSNKISLFRVNLIMRNSDAGLTNRYWLKYPKLLRDQTIKHLDK